MTPLVAHDSLVAPIRDAAASARRGLRWRVLRLRGLAGDSGRPDRSERAVRLTEAWDREWGGNLPFPWDLRDEGRGRWVRFHSLPEGKRYAETEDEYAEILRRHRTVIEELLDGADLTELVVIAVDWGRRDLATGLARRQVPNAWAWRRFVDEDDTTAPMYCWVQEGLTPDELDALLRAAADYQGRFVLTAKSLAWLYCPYDGGADVCARSTEQRASLAARHAPWLPDDDPAT